MARPAAKLAARIGYRPVLAAGAVSWAAGAVGLVLLIGGSPDVLSLASGAVLFVPRARRARADVTP